MGGARSLPRDASSGRSVQHLLWVPRRKMGPSGSSLEGLRDKNRVFIDWCHLLCGCHCLGRSRGMSLIVRDRTKRFADDWGRILGRATGRAGRRGYPAARPPPVRKSIVSSCTEGLTLCEAPEDRPWRGTTLLGRNGLKSTQ